MRARQPLDDEIIRVVFGECELAAIEIAVIDRKRVGDARSHIELFAVGADGDLACAGQPDDWRAQGGQLASGQIAGKAGQGARKVIRDVNLARIGADYHAIRTIKARCARTWRGQIGRWHCFTLADQVKGDRGLGWIVGRQGKLSSAHTNSCWEATDRDRGGCTSFCNRGR